LSGFEKLFTANRILHALAGAFTIGEAFKNILRILEENPRVLGACVLSYNRHRAVFEIHEGLSHKVEPKVLLELISANLKKMSLAPGAFVEPELRILADPKDRSGGYFYYPLFLNSELTGLFVLRLNFADDEAHGLDANLIEAIATPISIFFEREKLFRETKNQKTGFEFLHTLSNSINKTLDIESILKISVRTICKKFRDLVPVFVVSRGDVRLIMTGSQRFVDIRSNFEQVLDDIRNNLNENIDNFTVKIDVPQVKARTLNRIPAINLKSALWLSLNYNNNICGYLGIFSTGESLQKLDLTAIRFLTLASNQIISAIENARLYNEVERLASIDGMTGVYNYRYFYSHLVRESQRSRRYKTDLSVIMIDIDHFKSFNDTYGHQAGDDVLREVGKILSDEARKIDIVARYGGEEFILVLPDTSVEGALELAERIRYSVESNDFAVTVKGNRMNLKVSISLGVSSMSMCPGGVDPLIKAADEALYHAKHSGRNQVCYNDKNSLKQFRRQ